MAVAWIPPLLRDLTGGQEAISVPGATVRQVIEALEESFPGINERLCDGEGLRSGIAVAVDTEIARLGLNQPVAETSEVHFLPSIGGGSALPPSTRPGWWARNWRWLIPVGCMTPLLLCGVGIGIFLSVLLGILKSTDVYQQALARAQASPAVIQGLGKPIRPGYFVQGQVNVQDSSGTANLRIPIKGSTGGSGTIEVKADRVSGQWVYQKLEVRVEGRESPIDLLAGE